MKLSGSQEKLLIALKQGAKIRYRAGIYYLTGNQATKEEPLAKALALFFINRDMVEVVEQSSTLGYSDYAVSQLAIDYTEFSEHTKQELRVRVQALCDEIESLKADASTIARRSGEDGKRELKKFRDDLSSAYDDLLDARVRVRKDI